MVTMPTNVADPLRVRVPRGALHGLNFFQSKKNVDLIHMSPVCGGMTMVKEFQTCGTVSSQLQCSFACRWLLIARQLVPNHACTVMTGTA